MTTDEQIGQNLATLRGNLSQKDLAGQMRERGYKWSQATVWSNEKGERPLRLTEADDLAEVLGATLHMLTTSGSELLSIQAFGELHDAEAALEAAVASYVQSQRFLAFVLDHEGAEIADDEDFARAITRTPFHVALEATGKAFIDNDAHAAYLDFAGRLSGEGSRDRVQGPYWDLLAKSVETVFQVMDFDGEHQEAP